jgi:hypothetical protein
MRALYHRIVVGAVIAQAVMLLTLAIIFLIVLPARGITSLTQINQLDAFRRVQSVLLLVSWLHFLFSLAIGIAAIELFQQVRRRASLLVRFMLAAALLWVCIFFIGHDLGFGLILWPEIAADPASTAFSADLALLNVRNVIFFAISVLTLLDSVQTRRKMIVSDPTVQTI